MGINAGLHGGQASPKLVVSPDGYLRLTLPQFRQLSLQHVLSSLDEPTVDARQGAAAAGASLDALTGYTEWASEATPAASMGWDWQLCVDGRDWRYERVGMPRSNIMLVNRFQRDLGQDATEAALSLEIDELNWQETVALSIRTRYS